VVIGYKNIILFWGTKVPQPVNHRFLLV